MRSEILALNNKCSLSADCGLCGSLGYRSQKKWRRPFKKVEETRSKQVTGNLVLPCSSVEVKDFDQIIEKFKDAVSHVLFFRKWKLLSDEQRAKLLTSKLALIFDEFEQIQSSLIPESAELYFVMTPANWNIAQWQNPPLIAKERMNFFFPANPHGLSTLFNAEEVFDITESLLTILPKANFRVPFGHDLLDVRNSDHLNWILSETESFESNLTQALPAISIIIPSYNRAQFLLKILHCLEKQTLSPSQFEVLIIDDGSSDSTQKFIKEFISAHPKIKVRYLYVPRKIPVRALYNSNRAGPSRNLGAKKARGEILLFLDSDILIPETYLSDLIKMHEDSDVVVPRRVYLNKLASEKKTVDVSALQPSDRMQINWQDYLKEFYSTEDWGSLENPWRYFLTYSLSVRRDLFFKSGGFRTNFISYGYEDLDWGYRVVQCGARLKYTNTEVFHLYHFDGGSEYTLSEDFRFFQLAMTSRVFISQNVPLSARYLIGMTQLKNEAQRKYFRTYRFLWESVETLRRAKWKYLF